jgi:hypothetical protein
VILFTKGATEIKIYHPDDYKELRSDEQVIMYVPLKTQSQEYIEYDELRKLDFDDKGNRKTPLADDS